MVKTGLKFGEIILSVLQWGYFGGQVLTFVFLMFFDGFRYNWWNWIIAVSLNFILAAIWPIYWLLRLALGG